MEGGIRAWEGLTADGPPEGGVAYFRSGTGAADMAALAWALEENTRLFYTRLSEARPGTRETELFTRLLEAEEHHKETLSSLHGKLTEEPVDRFLVRQEEPLLEGGVNLEEVLEWTRDKPARRILAAAMGFEGNAYDRYLKMLDRSDDEEAQKVFRVIAREEKGHLEKLGELLERTVKEEER